MDVYHFEAEKLVRLPAPAVADKELCSWWYGRWGVGPSCFHCGGGGRAKKSGALKTDKDGMNVVPLVASEATKVVHHTVSRGNGNHGAISIVESGYEANVGASTRGGKGRRSISKAIGENTSEHLDVVMEQLYDDDGEFLDSSLDPLHRVVDRVLPDHELEQ
ncbi:hypothetical protein V6N13_001453 [Hibiscus sabdariffa]